MVQTAEHWYEVHGMADGVSLILESHFSAEWRCNIWHVRGRDRDLLVDTGLGLRPLAREIAALAERPVIAVCSHSHYDHSGGLHQFDDRRGHAAEADIYAHPTRDNTVTTGFLEADQFTASPCGGFDAERWCVAPAPLTGAVDEGDVIDLGDRVFRVYHVPGHSPGSIALWEEATGILFTGDALYDGDLIDDLYHSVPEELRASHERLRTFPVRVVHGGHYDSFDRDRMQVIIDEYAAGKRRWGCPAEA